MIQQQPRKTAYCLFGEAVDIKATIENITSRVQNLENVDFFIHSQRPISHPLSLPNIQTLEINSFEKSLAAWYSMFKNLSQLSSWPLSYGTVELMLGIEAVAQARLSSPKVYDLTVFSNWNSMYTQPTCFENWFPISKLCFSKQITHYTPTLSWFATPDPALRVWSTLPTAMFTWMCSQPGLDWNIGVVLTKFFASHEITYEGRDCPIHHLSKPLTFLKKQLQVYSHTQMSV